MLPPLELHTSSLLRLRGNPEHGHVPFMNSVIPHTYTCATLKSNFLLLPI